MARPRADYSLIIDAGDGLFVESWIYEYGLRDEYAVNAYWSGHYRECHDACLELLGCLVLPDGEGPRVEANARFATDRQCRIMRFHASSPAIL